MHGLTALLMLGLATAALAQQRFSVDDTEIGRAHV